MKIADIFCVVGGLALFLYGMRMMSDGLNLIAGAKLKTILEKLTKNKYLGIAVGMLIAGVIQSSNATTVMVVGFVNAKLMNLAQAVGVVIGAKVGTTITGQLIAFKADQIAPLIAFLGVAMIMFFKKKTVNHIGQVVAGLGILFLGMSTMQQGMAPLRESAVFQGMLSGISNPLLAVLVGFVFTTLIQSSSASVGIVQAMAAQGVLTVTQAAPIIYGFNIGACISAMISSIGGTKDAKRTAWLSVIFSVSGTALFLIFTKFIPFVPWIESLTPGDPMRQIANLHTLFNVISMLILTPTSALLIKLTRLIVRGEDSEDGMRLMYISDNALGTSAVWIAQVNAEVGRMHSLAFSNLKSSIEMIFTGDTSGEEELNSNEEIIDFLNREITRKLVKINSNELSTEDAKHLSSVYHVISDLERIGDHAVNICGYAIHMNERKIHFSDEAIEDLRLLANKIYTIVNDSFLYFEDRGSVSIGNIDELEQSVDDLTDAMAQGHVDRLSAQKCDADSGLIFREIITDLERVSDHALNIAQAADRESI